MDTNQDQNQFIRVVLADDHAVVRAGIRQFLELSGDIQVVAEGSDGEEARTLIERLRPDVAVLDIQMPRLTGIEVTRQVRAARLPVGILILTAYEDDPYVAAVLKAGANGYVLKTSEPEDIVEAVRDVNRGKQVLDPAILSKVIAQVSGDSFSHPSGELTGREMEVLELVAKGYTNKAIGVQLSISDRTVQGHLAKIFEKMQAASRTEAVMRAVSLRMLPPDIAGRE